MSLGQVLKMPAIRALWIGQLVSILGDFLALFAVISVVTYKLRGTPAEVTMIQMSFMAPLALVGPLAGVFVDRWDIRRTMIASDLIRAVLVLALLAAHDLRQIYVILFALSAVSAFFIPAQSVTLRTLVPPEGLLAANALMQQAMQMMRILGPFLAGVLVASFGAALCYWIDSASFLISAAILYRLVIHRPAAPSVNTIRSVYSDLAAGMRFIFTHAAVSFVIISMAAGMFAIGCFGPLIAVYVRDFLHGDERLFGLVSSLMGVGMIAGTLLIRRFAMSRSKSHLVIGGILGIGISVVMMAALDLTWLTVLGAFCMGAGVTFIIIPSQTLMQQETPKEMVGRVSSSVMSVLILAQVVGLTASGSLADAIGVRNLFFASAAMLAAIAVFGWLRLERR
jgi:MFS family permease